MKTKAKTAIKRGIITSLGAFGYLFCSLQWLWVALLYFSVIQSAILLVAPPAAPPVAQTHTTALPGPIEMVIFAIITAIMIILTIYALVTIPSTIAKTGNKIVYKTSEAITPVILRAQHKKETGTLRDKLTPKIVLFIKLLIIAVPFVLTALSHLLTKPMISDSIAMTIGGGLALLSVFFFGVQYMAVRILRIPMLR